MWEMLAIDATSIVVSLLFGMPLAWLLVNRKFAGDRELDALATAALALPAPVLAYYVLLGPDLLAPGGFTAAAVLSAAPLLIRAGRTALGRLDPVYGNTARSLGATDWRTFWRVELPLIWRSVAAAIAIAFVRVLAELGLVIWLSVRLPSHD